MEGRDLSTYCVVADLGGSKVLVGWGESPCMTRTRGKALAYFSLQHGRPLNAYELCQLQGLDMYRMNTTQITDHKLGGLLGNGFTCSMIQRIVNQALMAVMEASGMARQLVPAEAHHGAPESEEKFESLHSWIALYLSAARPMNI